MREQSPLDQRILTYYVRGSNQCTADLLFDWFGFDQTSNFFVNST